MSKKIYIAGGCFWGVQAYFSLVNGVLDTTCGYANGKTQEGDCRPTYEEVCTGRTGFAEAVEVEYDPAVISLEGVLKHYFKIVDPTSLNKQANDIGKQYRSGLYYVDEADKEPIEAEVSKQQANFSKKIVTEVKRLKNFYPAEDYHQNYLKKNPSGYCHINLSGLCGDE